MLINLTELFTREGKTNDYAVELDCREFQIPQGICPVSDSKPVALHIENVGDRTLVLSGEAEFTLMIPCDRCLEPVEVPFQLSIERTLDMNLTDEDPDIVVLGFDTTLTYEKLSKACHYIRNGCTYFGINPDWNCPMEGGTFIPDCGSMAKLIEASTGRFPEFFGKPSKHTLDYIIQQTGYEPDEIAIVGDRLYTDIAVADQSDVTSILVLSGESTREDVKTSDVKPDVILEDLSEITKML